LRNANNVHNRPQADLSSGVTFASLVPSFKIVRQLWPLQGPKLTNDLQKLSGMKETNDPKIFPSGIADLSRNQSITSINADSMDVACCPL
jgi:hypothetical protein